MPIPPGIKREHVLAAAQWIEEHGADPFGDGIKYETEVDEKFFPPKALVGHAARIGLGIQTNPDSFSSGHEPGQAIPELKRLGFKTRLERFHPTRSAVRRVLGAVGFGVFGR